MVRAILTVMGVSVAALCAVGLGYGAVLTLCELRLWRQRRRVLRVGGRR